MKQFKPTDYSTMKKLFLTIAAVLMLTSSAHAEGFAFGVTLSLIHI